MNRDTVIGIVGAFILVAAMVGVFQYERARAPGAIGPADWALENMTLPEVAGSTALAASSEETINVTQQNATMVTFTLTWTPSSTPAGANTDTVRLTLTPPEGIDAPAASLTMEGTSGTLDIPVELANAKPTAATPGMLGTGSWTATIEYVSTDDPTAPLQLPAQGQVSWTLAVTATAWEPVDIASGSDA